MKKGMAFLQGKTFWKLTASFNSFNVYLILCL